MVGYAFKLWGTKNHERGHWRWGFNIWAVSIKSDIAIYREHGVIVTDASYGKRFSLFWILDGFIILDDLVTETASMSRT